MKILPNIEGSKNELCALHKLARDTLDCVKPVFLAATVSSPKTLTSSEVTLSSSEAAFSLKKPPMPSNGAMVQRVQSCVSKDGIVVSGLAGLVDEESINSLVSELRNGRSV